MLYKMVFVRSFDMFKYNLPVQGDGFVDTVKSVADIVTQNKEVIKDVGNAVSSVSGAAGNISEAIKAAKRFNELQLAKNKLSPKVINELKSVNIDNSKMGDGFEKF